MGIKRAIVLDQRRQLLFAYVNFAHAYSLQAAP